MIRLDAPAPLYAVSTYLPNPKFSDVRQRLAQIDKKRAMTGRLFSYVNDEAVYRLTYNFDLVRLKSLELDAFLQAYLDSQIRINAHDGKIYVGYIEANPFEFQQQGRIQGATSKEHDAITLIFEGVLQ